MFEISPQLNIHCTNAVKYTMLK